MKTRLLLIALLASFSSFGQDLTPCSVNNEIVYHSFYKLSYSEIDEQAEWVYYELNPSKQNTYITRSDNFRPDLKVSSQSAQLSDYYKSGYDRGHLAPANDMKYSSLSMSESFLLSNISPQDPSFNRGIWKRLEQQIHNWAIQYNKLVIITGPILNGEYYGAIGSNLVSIPKYYYKVIIDPTDYYRNIAFIIENKKSNDNLQDFVVSIDSLESITGIDFFCELDEKEEETIESSISLSIWNWGNVSKHNNSQSSNRSTEQTNSTSKTVYKTSTGKKYHQGSCRYLSKSKIALDLNEAKRIGLLPCSVCKPHH